jgi:DNA-binding CsgD family transcriptional regulator
MENESTARPEPSAEELVIVALLAQGLTDDVVARRLDMAKRTYRRRLDDLWTKLGARSRFQAGAMAAQRGWVEPIDGRTSDPFWPRTDEGPVPAEQEPATTQANEKGDTR